MSNKIHNFKKIKLIKKKGSSLRFVQKIEYLHFYNKRLKHLDLFKTLQHNTCLDLNTISLVIIFNVIALMHQLEKEKKTNLRTPIKYHALLNLTKKKRQNKINSKGWVIWTEYLLKCHFALEMKMACLEN